jgi:hypothetical protein
MSDIFSKSLQDIHLFIDYDLVIVYHDKIENDRSDKVKSKAAIAFGLVK